MPPLMKMDSARGCVSESNLLAAGLIGGQVVQKADPDSNFAVLIISGGHICTASPIRDNVLLTAAHCFDKDKLSDTVAVFYPSLSCESGYDKRQHSVPALSVAIHDDFKSDVQIDKTEGDMALVFLSSKIPDNYPIYKVGQPSNIAAGSDLVLYGYGRTNSNGGGSGILRKIHVGSDNYVVSELNKRVVINQSQGSGICNGDSGGASLVTNRDGEMQILGISSYVTGPTEDVCSAMGVQTLASTYNDWIERIIAEQGNANPIPNPEPNPEESR
ncbi:S1 family peptidase [Pseudobdellovibrio exovorus]|nr:trypsin-like serine protease [Pseudobdellovibrio exovorus]